MATTKAALTCWAPLVVLFWVSTEAGLPLPSVIKPCSRSDPKLNECATRNGNAAIPKIINGIPGFGVPSLDPFFIKRIKVDGSSIGVQLDFMDVNLLGFSETKVKGIQINLDPPHFKWKLYTPVLQMVGKYEASGRILILPITGKGDFNFTLYGMDYTYEFSCDIVKKSDGEMYFSPRGNAIDYSIQNANLRLDNLFNGNKLLGDEMNRFMNENWKEVDQSIGPKIAESVATAMQVIARAVTSRVPVSMFFDK